MFSSTIDYRWHVQCFPQDLNRLLPLNPIHCFAIYFETILIWFLCILSFWSISVLLFIPHWQGGFFIGRCPVKTFKQECAYIKWLGVACPAIHITNHYYQLVARILIILCAQNHPVAFWEGDFSLSKVYEGSLGCVEVSPLTLRNHFIQLYRIEH